MYLEFDKTHGSSLYHRFLITPKLFVFFYSASLGCLLPFLPVFFRLNGLSAVQTGFLVAARYLVLFWAAPVFSFFASRLNFRKLVLVLAVLMGAMANAAFLFTSDYKDRLRTNCPADKTMTQSPVNTMNGTTSTMDNNAVLLKHNTSTPNYLKSEFNFTSKIEEEIFNSVGLKFDRKFLYFLLIISVGTLLSSPAKPLHELVTLAIIKEFKASYNAQRVCSCLGWSVMSFATAMIIYKLPCSFHLSKNAFDLHFCLHILFATTALMFAMLMKSPTQKASTKFKMCRVIKAACTNANIIVVVLSMAILGTAQSVTSTYLLWYVQDLSGNELHFGSILLVSGLCQIPLLFGTKYLIHWLGHGWVFFLSLFAFGARFLLYSYSNNPILIIPIEVLHTFTSSSIWLNSMSMAVLVAPIGFERSLQNLFSASYYGLGMGFGGILTSIAYQLYGATPVFQYAAVVCAVYAVVMAILQCLISPPDEHQGLPINGDYYKVGVNSNSQSDWLLEALNADEEEVHYSRVK